MADDERVDSNPGNQKEEETTEEILPLKNKIGAAAGVNVKTVERNTKALLLALFGVTEKELEEDIYLRKYLRWIFFHEDPRPWIILEQEDDPEKTG